MSLDPTATPQATPPQKSWFGRNCIWLVPLILLVMGSPFLCCGGLALFGFNAMQAPLDAATDSLNADARVVEKLGSPITRGSSMKMTNYNNNNGNGGATIEFNASGPNGGAQVSGKMALTAGKWRPDGLTVTCDDGTEFQLPEQQ